MREKSVIYVIGGASGVGKTSLLRSFVDIKQVNTGDLFKASMSVVNRDEIKNANWSMFEADVTSRMIDIISEAIQSDEDLIIDTHFAAKTRNKRYRIGLKEEYLYKLGESIFTLNTSKEITLNVILITSNPYLLLTRRRLDKSRNRDLVPSDCYNDLRCNNTYSRFYLSALHRAERKKGAKLLHNVKYHVVTNKTLELAQKQLTDIIRR